MVDLLMLSRFLGALAAVIPLLSIVTAPMTQIIITYPSDTVVATNGTALVLRSSTYPPPGVISPTNGRSFSAHLPMFAVYVGSDLG